ncbi:PucR family transcriptional regulator [Actinomadura sp. GTD37]|uniref:PucR family transcriptional regulator n=1 Tax=Actinomadura sp. GTD37 TaxID=1778030 RepID=UPI0035C26E9E
MWQVSCGQWPLPVAAADRDPIARVRAELPSLAEEILEESARTVPLVAALLRGDAAARRPGAGGPARPYLERLANPRMSRSEEAALFRSLGEDACAQGLPLDSLQAAFRVGTQIAWRRFARVCRETGASSEQLCRLTEALFAAVDKISSDFTAGYAERADRDCGALRAKRARLLDALLSGPTAETAAELSRAAHWRLPRAVACVALDGPARAADRMAPALDPDVLVDLQRPDPCLLLPDPDGPGRLDVLRRALRGIRHAVGPGVPPRDAQLSRRLADRALTLLRGGRLGDVEHVRCTDHLPALLMAGDEDVARRLVARRLAVFAGMRPDQRRRLEGTLLEWLATGGTFPEVAARLSVHPQTVRYRMRRLEELFGDRLQDPGWRYETLLALQADRLFGRAAPAEPRRAIG